MPTKEVRLDRAMLERHLKLAEEHVELGRRHLAQQMAIVSKLEQDGRNTTKARALLATFESMQEIHEADRDRLEKKLADYDDERST